MATTVKIIYTGPIVDISRKGTAIMRIFTPDNSYVDTPVFTDGYENADAVGDKGTYGKSIYATNVPGWGKLAGLLPMASTTTKFAQFERAVIAKFDAEQSGGENTGITFSIDDYQEEIYWNQIAANMWQESFYIEVGDNHYGIAPAS
jgi:hypothetical protein